MRVFNGAVVLACLIGVAARAEGGTVLNMERQSDVEGAAGPFVVAIDGPLLRVDSNSGEEPSIIIFRADRNELLFVDREREIYSTFDGNKLRAAAARTRPDFVKIPDNELPVSLSGLHVRPTDRFSEANGTRCQHHDVDRQGVNVRSHCVVRWNEILSGASIRPTLLAFSQLAQDLAGAVLMRIPMGGSLENPFTELTYLDGFPLFTAGIEKGETTWRTSLLSIDTRSLDPSFFKPPVGYAKHEAPLGGH
jgi:hypothetical protein